MFQVSVSVSAQDGTVVLGKAHMHSTPSLSSLPKVALETQAWELKMEKSAEKWGPGGRRMPPVGVQGGTPPVGVRGRIPLKLKLFNKNKT